MDYSPLISVIIPIYNAEKYLKQCLNSVIIQNFNNIEIICINDGSTDNSQKILEKFSKKDNRFKIITTSNKGQGSARNLGLKHAKGEYISFIDADDWIEKNTYSLLYDKAKKNNLDMLFFQMINYMQDSGEFVETELYNYKSLIDNFEDDAIFSIVDIEKFLFNIAVCPVSKLYKKSFLDKNKIVFPEKMIFEDNIFFYNAILKADKLGYVAEKLYYRRRHSNSVTQNISKKSFDIILATNKMLNLFKDKGVYDKFKESLINHTFSMILEWFFKCDLLLSDEFYIKIKQEFLGCNDLSSDFKKYLNEDNIILHNLFLKNDYYLDFLSEYKLSSIEYENLDDYSDYKISIIIPVYNNFTLIHRTLMSIMHQSIGFENIEVILVNDNSNEKTYDVLNSYANNFSNIKVIHLENNTGSAGTPRNVGIKVSSSDYLMFLDHDDYFEFDSIEKLYDIIINEDVDLVFGTYSVIQNDKPQDIFYPKEKHGFFNSIEENERFIGFPPPSIWTKIFKKDIIMKNNILFPPILGEDAIFLNKFLLKSSGIYYLHDSLICYHDLNHNSTTNKVTYKYLIEGLFSEKYLCSLFKNINKEDYFKFRCEANLDFFLSQYLKSNLTKNQIKNILPLFNWFISKSIYYNIRPNNHNNEIIFDFFINEDVDSLYNFRNKLSLSKKHYIIKRIFGDKFSLYFKRIFKSFKKIFS